MRVGEIARLAVGFVSCENETKQLVGGYGVGQYLVKCAWLKMERNIRI